jgi:hypothetical protein
MMAAVGMAPFPPITVTRSNGAAIGASGVAEAVT